MIHEITFERFDFTVKPATRETKVVVIEFDEVTDFNVVAFENKAWAALWELSDTKAKGHFSSWLRVYNE